MSSKFQQSNSPWYFFSVTFCRLEFSKVHHIYLYHLVQFHFFFIISKALHLINLKEKTYIKNSVKKTVLKNIAGVIKDFPLFEPLNLWLSVDGWNCIIAAISDYVDHHYTEFNDCNQILAGFVENVYKNKPAPINVFSFKRVKWRNSKNLFSKQDIRFCMNWHMNYSIVYEFADEPVLKKSIGDRDEPCTHLKTLLACFSILFI